MPASLWTLNVWDLGVLALTAIGLAATLQAAGAVVFSRLFSGLFSGLFEAELPAAGERIDRLARLAALSGIAAAVMRQLLLAGVLAGSAAGLVDVRVHEMLLTSDAGTATCLRALALLLIAACATRAGAGARLLTTAGAVLAIASFAFVGHTAANPFRLALAPLLLMHLSLAAFWFGGLVPLRFVLATEPVAAAARILEAYSRYATRLVPGIAAAGLALALLLTPEPMRLVASAYGQILAIKLALFALLMVLAALNKMRWVPAFANGDERARLAARNALRRSIAAEAILIVLVLAATAALTGLTGPPGAESAAGW